MRVDKFKENFGENYEDKSCPVCKLQLDTQVRSVQCEKVKDGIKIGSEIFKEKVPSNMSQTLLSEKDAVCLQLCVDKNMIQYIYCQTKAKPKPILSLAGLKFTVKNK